MTSQIKDPVQDGKNNDEIDILALTKKIWLGRRIVFLTIIVFTIIGLFFAFFSPKVYTASTTIVPQLNTRSPNMGGLSSLASLAGFNIDMRAGEGELSPLLYPQILNSTTFILEIINSEYSFDELAERITLFDYYMNHYRPGIINILKKFTIGLPGQIISSLKKNDQVSLVEDTNSEGIIRINEDQYEVLEIVKEKLRLNVNDKDGYITIESDFEQPSLAAQVVEKAKYLLQERITELKVEKARAQVEFIEERYQENKKEFEIAQERLATFRDANKNISSELKRTEEEQLQNEYQLAFDVYSELAKQLEQAKIKEKEDTPVFAVINEVVEPIEKTKPNRSLILISWILLGGIIGVGIIFSKTFFLDIKNRWIKIETEDN